MERMNERDKLNRIGHGMEGVWNKQTMSWLFTPYQHFAAAAIETQTIALPVGRLEIESRWQLAAIFRFQTGTEGVPQTVLAGHQRQVVVGLILVSRRRVQCAELMADLQRGLVGYIKRVQTLAAVCLEVLFPSIGCGSTLFFILICEVQRSKRSLAFFP